MVQATSLFIKRNIHIVNSANNGQALPFSVMEGGQGAGLMCPLWIGYYQSQHYQSLSMSMSFSMSEDYPPEPENIEGEEPIVYDCRTCDMRHCGAVRPGGAERPRHCGGGQPRQPQHRPGNRDQPRVADNTLPQADH